MVDEQGSSSGPQARAPAAPRVLAEEAALWLQQLPSHAQPRRTAAQFPHIVNALASSWQTPQRCRAYLEQLLLDQRGNRQGFPKAVASELAVLKDYYDSVVHPTQQRVWDEIVSHHHG